MTATDAERLGPYGHMKPYLKSQKDVDFIWQHIDAVDIIESDHAPHTREEKDSATPPFGVPGLETTLPLMLTAEAEGRLTHIQLLERLHSNAARLFKIKVDDSTKVEVDMSEHEIKNDGLHTKSGWTPFAGRRVIGKVETVYLHGIKVYENGEVLVSPGSGQTIS